MQSYKQTTDGLFVDIKGITEVEDGRKDTVRSKYHTNS